MIVIQLNHNSAFDHWHGYLIKDPLTINQQTIFSATEQTKEKVLEKVQQAAHNQGVKVDATWE